MNLGKKITVSFFVVLLCAISMHAMEQQESREYDLFNSKESELTKEFVQRSTDQDVIVALSDMLDEKINATLLKEPQTLLDGIVQLNQLLGNFEVNLKGSDSSLLSNGLLINGCEIPSCPLFVFWMQEALKLVFENNKKVKSLIAFVVEKLAMNVTKSNKEKCIQLLNNYLPTVALPHIMRKLEPTYAWSELTNKSEGTNEDIIISFKKLINKNINTIHLEAPKGLLDAVVQLNQLFRNLEINLNESTFSFLSNDLLINGHEIPSHSSSSFWIQEALRRVLENNKKVEKLVDFVIERIAKNVTRDNQKKCLELVSNKLPRVVAKHVANRLAHTYGWYNTKGLHQDWRTSSTKIRNLFPLDSARIAVKLGFGDIKIFNLKIRDYLKNRILMFNNTISSWAYNNKNVIAIGFSNGRIITWNIDTDKRLYLEGGDKTIINLNFLDDTTLASGYKNCLVKFWNASTGDYLRTFDQDSFNAASKSQFFKFYKNSMQNVSALQQLYWNRLLRSDNNNQKMFILNDTQFLFINDDLLEMGLMDLRTVKQLSDLEQENAKKLTSYKGHTGKITDIAMLDGSTFASASEDKTIKIWDLQSGKCKKTLKGHRNEVRALKAVNSTMLVSSSFHRFSAVSLDPAEQSVKVWNVNTGNCLQTFDDFKQMLGNITLTDDVLVAHNGNEVRIIDMPTFEQTINFLANRNSNKKASQEIGIKQSCTIG